jgi:antirestriction protein ArdC
MNDRALLAQARVRALTNPNCVKTSGSLADFLEEIHIEEPSVDYPYRDKINGRWGEILYLGFINSRHVGDLHHGTWVWKTRNPDTLLPVVEEAIRATGATVEVLDAIELDAARVVGAGFYNPETGKIFVFPFRSYRSAAHYYGSILHEITHWTGAKDRLKRGVEAGPSETSSFDYGLEEMTADMTALLILSDFGLATDAVLDERSEYIGGYWRVKCRGHEVTWTIACEQALEAAAYLRERMIRNSGRKAA